LGPVDRLIGRANLPASRLGLEVKRRRLSRSFALPV
jgi:hypothetical protein